ncbi:sensor histidine kinase [Streptomyces sp. NPDC059718]
MRQLASRTHQRIRLTEASDGYLVADSDLLTGRDPREAGPEPPLLIDPRPDLTFPDNMVTRGMLKLTAAAIAKYHTEALYASCLNADVMDATTKIDPLGIPEVVSTPHGSLAQKCKRQPYPDADFNAAITRVQACLTVARPDGCLQRAFEQEIVDVAPPKLQLQLGAMDESVPVLKSTPTILVAAGVVAAVTAGALLLSRTVLRPVRALTHASREVEQGNLALRVPVSGRDEIAQLARAYNRMAASLQASEERQRRLMGDIAHELRTPLANLRGYLEALRDGVLEPSPGLLHSLHDEAVLQQRIVDDLQDLALAEAGALSYHRTRIDLRELLQACHTAHHHQALSTGLTLELRAHETAWADGDWDRLRQVLSNLVTNAIRATPPGGTISLAFFPVGDLAAIQVTDTGTGIATEDLPHLFDRFWRADPARGRTTGGTGLGLSITRRIITDHNGTITVESTVGVGTTFTISLPTRPRTPIPDPRCTVVVRSQTA